VSRDPTASTGNDVTDRHDGWRRGGNDVGGETDEDDGGERQTDTGKHIPGITAMCTKWSVKRKPVTFVHSWLRQILTAFQKSFTSQICAKLENTDVKKNPTTL